MDKYSRDGVLGNAKIQGEAREVGGWTGGDTDEVVHLFLQQIFVSTYYVAGAGLSSW